MTTADNQPIREPYIDLFSSSREEIINWRNYFERDLE